MAKRSPRRKPTKVNPSERMQVASALAAETRRYLRLCRKVDSLLKQVKRIVPKIGVQARDLGAWLQQHGNDIVTAADERS